MSDNNVVEMDGVGTMGLHISVDEQVRIMLGRAGFARLVLGWLKFHEVVR
ncbi:hypothetical protein TIFTF001_021830 [Ficus carica]|uniref:Uncharacterized protein n=1 Tax=Ficus carica TaxID=3494 RepID=A0AA88AT11_FICCA|nr:hypothetical protein TIFTF001_021830 [Ficus carica]